MKAKIHPQYVEATIVCACGHTWKTRSTKEVVHLDICSNCHPYFTGEQRIVDTAGRLHVDAEMMAEAQRDRQANESPAKTESVSDRQSPANEPGKR